MVFSSKTGSTTFPANSYSIGNFTDLTIERKSITFTSSGTDYWAGTMAKSEVVGIGSYFISIPVTVTDNGGNGGGGSFEVSSVRMRFQGCVALSHDNYSSSYALENISNNVPVPLSTLDLTDDKFWFGAGDIIGNGSSSTSRRFAMSTTFECVININFPITQINIIANIVYGGVVNTYMPIMQFGTAHIVQLTQLTR